MLAAIGGGLNLVVVECGKVIWAVAAGEERGVNAGVEGLDFPAEQLRSVGALGDPSRSQPALLVSRRLVAARRARRPDLIGARRLRSVVTRESQRASMLDLGGADALDRR